MTRLQFLIPLACCFLATLTTANPVLGQSDNSDSQLVAILDIERVFKEDAKFQATLDDLKERGTKSVEVNQTEDAKTKSQAINAELLDQESVAYFDCYSRMSKVVKGIAKQHSIKLVIRADTSAVDKHDRAAVIERINSSVIFHDKLDLTNMVIAAMKKSQEASVSTRSSLPRLTPKYCDQCGQKLSKGQADCQCLEIDGHADQ